MTIKSDKRRLCKTHAAHVDGCLDCAIDHALDQSPERVSMLGLAGLIPENLQRAYMDLIVRAAAQEIGAPPA